MKRIGWTEASADHWDGGQPAIEMLIQEPEVDEVGQPQDGQVGFLLELSFSVDTKTTTWREKELKRQMMRELDAADVLINPARASRDLSKLKAVAAI